MTKAMTLAPGSWEANFSHAFYWFYFERDWRQAEPHFKKAIAISPRSSLAQAYYAIFLSILRREEDAVSHAALACQLDPLSPYIHGAAAVVFNALRRFEDAERAARQALELQPDYLFGLWQRGIALSGLARHEEAVEALERVVTLSRSNLRRNPGARIRACGIARRRHPPAAGVGGSRQPRRIYPSFRAADGPYRSRRSPGDTASTDHNGGRDGAALNAPR
jgi:tetratricopeptide (TPR) repeat protein